MKKIFKYTLTILAVIGLSAACQKEVKDVYVPAKPDQSDCLDVYFKAGQDAFGDHQLDPTADTWVKVTVLRPQDKSTDEAVVEYTITETKDGEPVEGIFKGSEIKFGAGQTEATLKLTFDDAEVGIPYSCTVTLKEGAYASLYTSGATQFTYSVTRVKWNFLGKGLWREDIFSGTMGSYVSPANPVWEVSIYEREDKKGMYRVTDVYNEEHVVGWLADGFKEYHDGLIDGLIIEVDATNPNKVWFPYITIGWQFYSNGPFYFGSLVDENLAACPDMKGYTSADNYGTLVDGMITFPARGIGYGFSAEEWWGRANTSGLQYIALPGVTPVDYSIKLASSLTEEGVTPIKVTAGIDVASIKYAVYEGELNAAQAANRAAAIIDGTDASEVFTDLTPNAAGTAATGVMGITAEATGVYTLVAITYDKDGKDQQNASISFTYVADSEPVPVVISCGAQTTGKYEPKGLTAENSIEFYIYGKEIIDAKVGLFKYLDLASKGQAAIDKSVKSAKSLSAEALEALNADGYVDVMAGLSPGTQYFLAVWASNGYEETIIYSDFVTTAGDPLPIYMDYTAADSFYEEGKFANREAAYGTWNYYGTDAYGSLGMREYLGPVVISASESETEGPDTSGLYDEYVYMTGLFGDLSWLANYGMSADATVEMDVYGGIIYHFQKTVVEGNYQVLLGAKAGDAWGYTLGYGTAFIPVAEGYYAFVDVSEYVASYNFCGLALRDPDAGWIAKIWDPLLVNPELDNNGVIPASVAASTDNAKRLMQDITIHHDNLVETEKGRLLSIFDEYNKTARNFFAPVGIEGAERTPKQVSVKVVSLQDFQPKAQAMDAPGFLTREVR